MLSEHTLSQLRTSVHFNYGSDPHASGPKEKKKKKKGHKKVKAFKTWTVNTQAEYQSLNPKPYLMYYKKHKQVIHFRIYKTQQR